MIAKRIAGATHRLGAPSNWTEGDGKCHALSIRQRDGCCESAWEPTPAELEMLNAGGSVILRVRGGQLPVFLYVEPFVEAQ